MNSQKCECDHTGILNPGMASWYDPVTELPFVKHEPDKCKCTNNIRLYVRKGKKVWLCSCCFLTSDKLVPTEGQVEV